MAEDALISPALWESCAARVNPTPMAVHEHNNYRLLSQFVGRGEVGRMFEGV